MARLLRSYSMVNVMESLLTINTNLDTIVYNDKFYPSLSIIYILHSHVHSSFIDHCNNNWITRKHRLTIDSTLAWLKYLEGTWSPLVHALVT